MLASVVEVVDFHEVLEITHSLSALRMPDEMNFLCFVPTTRQAVGVAKDFPFLDPSQVSRFVVVLSMFAVEVLFPINLFSKRVAVSLGLLLYLEYSY